MIFIIIYTLNKVCDDLFDSTDAESACHTLGYYGGSFKTINQQDWSFDEIPILMDNVECTSSNDNFLDCPYEHHNCDHDENILLFCVTGELNLFKTITDGIGFTYIGVLI